uniref:Uncharacterized protein n=1 Tax=Eutreptiella gymnastica TaxID=73025 RepID=A0A7S4LCW7_9EUGL|mmetsp:Transcript_100260/g.169342  ORF Transcript_100260/g.169342 Transcript_100260/m.169342 type:complete len:103 (+) Transcript_100260:297-605(+)
MGLHLLVLPDMLNWLVQGVPGEKRPHCVCHVMHCILLFTLVAYPPSPLRKHGPGSKNDDIRRALCSDKTALVLSLMWDEIQHCRQWQHQSLLQPEPKMKGWL